MLLRYILVCVSVLAGSICFAQELPRTASGKPQLSGIWQVQNRAAVDILAHVASSGKPAGLSVVEGDFLPYRPQAQAQQLLNSSSSLSADPLNHCYLPGVPRIMYMEFPFEIVQSDAHIALTFEWQQVFRLIYINDEDSLYEGVESWMGHSRAHWEGDELVVRVKDFNDKTWLDAAGNFHSAAMVLTERYRMLDADTISYQVTIQDPEVFTRDVVLQMNLYRQKELDRVLEYQCQALKEEASGAFERDERTWYPAGILPEYESFKADAGIKLPLPPVAADIPRLADGTPDIGGYFIADAGGANYGLETSKGGFLLPQARGVVVDPADGNLPYQSWARAEKIDRGLPQRGYDDPTAHCFVAGIPRSHYVPSPFYIVQGPERIAVLHERMSWRQIDLQRSEHLPDNIRLWQGDSLGHWEGDTLVVDSRNFNGKAWLNEAGDVISHMAVVQESYTLVSADQIIYRATISDPIAFTRPWTIELPLNRMNDELLEVACLEDNNDLQHLKDVRDEFRANQRTSERATERAIKSGEQ